MLLSSINVKSSLLESIFQLYLLLEDINEPYWPREWSDRIINDPKFQSFLENLGVTGQIGKPMSGTVGRAYAVGDDHIVKFTTNSKEAGAAATIQGHNSDHAADILAVHRIPKPFKHPRENRNINMFVIVMERLNTGVSKKFRIAGNAVYSYLDDYSGFIEDPQIIIDTVMTKYIDKKLINDPNIKFAVEQITNGIYDLQQKTGVLTQDPHGGNIAFKGRKPAFFDFGRSSTNYDNPKTKNARITAL